ncbi:BREX system serine/threonine kinase PglW [Saccharomonospora xinjiangensis]|uniref:BREX system serine/threonine kinase PglW n=1 Tax=Saccharomonospora xinjiangensis TaxID=75294 RepID=UPI00107053C5|nr:BREX system serine/threonine kinase PglW [Saccharomonospora xinjiangensis]QBQ58961.1 Serine/threonine-protein kinase PrkC [Saccharomonospora xinjiangensis]
MSDGRAPAPKPAPPPPVERWRQERTSPYPWEQDGLDHIRRLMPQAEPYRAWATFSFTAASGRVNECDLLIAVPGGLYLLELKGHTGRVVNSGETWSFFREGVRRPRTLRNPLHLTDLKCKELKGRLEWAAKQNHFSGRIPRIEPAIFLSAPGLVSELDEVQRTRVYGRDEQVEGLDWIWRDLLSRPPQREQQRISPEFSRYVLPRLLERIGIRASVAHLRFGDDWVLANEVLDAGPTWEDRLAERTSLVHEQGRVRIYLTEQQAVEERRQSVERAARREYQVLQGITHRGIAQAVQIREHQGGPAILFRHDASDLRLDSYLDVHGENLSIDTRLDLVRQLAEAVQYAHHRSLYHRALSARSVWVSAKDDGSDPVLRITDWQAAARDFDTTSLSTVGKTSLTREHLANSAEVYLAPEFAPHADPVDLDVFGLGAVSFLILTGRPPAGQRSGLIERLAESHGLHPYAVADGISDALDALVFDATRTDLAQRLDSADAFLKRLDAAEWESLPESSVPVVDPLTVSAGQLVDEQWRVERVLGTGATARALLVRKVDTADTDTVASDTVERRVLKVALDDDKAQRLHAEARALALVGGGVVVKLLDGPREVGGRTVLDLEYAGGQDPDGPTLGEWLRAEGKLTYHNLERYGRDLFTALDHLAGKGVRHRDLKPDNFGIYRRADRSTQLMLFDFSLADVSERDVTAGTRGYLDPFLGTSRRPVYDDHAERYAAAVTLHEMASGQRPVWGDGVSDPRTTSDETPVLAAEAFEPALRDGLTEFFRRALHRDVNRRFDTLRQMEDAWREVFTSADTAAPLTSPGTVGIEGSTLEATRDAHADKATLDTQLDLAGLSPRAVSLAQSLGATTVRELLEQVRPYEISRARGAGKVVRNELNRRHKQWTHALLRRAEPDGPAPETGDGPATLDGLVALLLPVKARRGSRKADVVRLTLGLPEGSDRDGHDGGEDGAAALSWPTQTQVADRLGVTQATVSQHYRKAMAAWAAEPRVAALREEVVRLLAEAGRVMTAHELAAAVKAAYGGAERDTRERALARALAVVRAAVDTEAWDRQQEGREGAEDGPRFSVLRRGEHVVVALESLPGTDEPSAPELADYAVALGARADELVMVDPLPGRGVVVRELRAVRAPKGLSSQADTRLVELAAAMSVRAAASPRSELYPRSLDLVRALRMSQAAVGVRRETGIAPADLLAKVRARFPSVSVADDVTYVRLEEALRAAGTPLEYDPEKKLFYPPAPEFSRLASSSSTTRDSSGGPRPGGLDPHELLGDKLARSVEQGGFLALTLRGTALPGAAEALASRYPVRPVQVDREFLAVFRGLVVEYDQDWERVRKLDERFGRTGEPKPGFRRVVRLAWERLRDRLVDQAGARTVLLLHHADLVGRYADLGGREFLTGLQQAARSAEALPHGLWVLCPGESAEEAPQLDGLRVEALTESERAALGREFVQGLRVCDRAS